jgi:large subunit ribosomal protein L2
MAMKTYKPTTPGQRHKVTVRRDHLWKGKPFRALTVGKRSTGGRNNLGRITAFHRGGGHKRRLRFVDLMRSLSGVEGVVKRLEYDPNRSADIALIEYGREHDTAKGGSNKYGSNSFVAKGHAYIIAPEGLKPGDRVTADNKDATISPGNAFKLRDIPVGVEIHNIELNPGKGGQMVRSAGATATLMRREAEDGFCIVKLPSGEQRYVKGGCMATIGAVGNKDHHNRKLGKAGASRWRGRRPVVRGVAMNPVDHPHGGGEGKSSGGRPSSTPWGKPTKGYKTRKKKKDSNKFIHLSRHNAKKKRKQ